MKKLYEFTLKEKVTNKVEEKSTDKDGNEVTITKDKTEEVDRVVFLKKPSRSMYDEAELYYGVQLSEGIKAGLLTRALLAKRFSNDGGIMSDTEKKEYADLYLKLFENQNSIQRLSAIKKEERTPEESVELEKATQEDGLIKKEIQEFEMAQSSLFDQTAENRARNKTILWWVLSISYLEDKEGKPTPIFAGDSLTEKLNSYDLIEEEGTDFQEEVIKKLIYYVSYWYVSSAQTPEEFQELIKALDEEGSKEDSEQAIEDAISGEKEPKKPAKKKRARKKKTEEPKEEVVAQESQNTETDA
tara:strand:+ start:2299 stop:3201 length:903 start_codon:yes stop_codon:yes gene_type:complete